MAEAPKGQGSEPSDGGSGIDAGLTDQKLQILLKEYEVSQAYSSHKETQVWQTASIFIALSLAGIALLGRAEGHSWSQLGLVAIVGVASIAILLFWSRILIRWTNYDRITMYRMREIESELGMWKNRYIDDLDYYQENEEHKVVWLESEATAPQRLSDLAERYGKTWSAKGGGQAVGWIRWTLILAWVVIVLQEWVFTVLHYGYPDVFP